MAPSGIGILALTLLWLPIAAHPAAAATRASGLDGAGFQNVVAVDPHGTGTVVSGADIAGIQLSRDDGVTFEPKNDAVTIEGQLDIATVVFATTSDEIYVGAGAGGTANGFWVSHDGGETWTQPTIGSTKPNFSGINLDGLAYRSTGTLIALDETVTPPIIYAATYDDGVMRSTDDGVTWTVVGLAGKHLRSIALNPRDHDDVYVASYDDGVYEASNADGSCTGSCELFTKMPGSPLFPEELVALSDASTTTLYAAAAANAQLGISGGIFKLTGSSWTKLGGSALSGDAIWFAIDGYVSPNGTRHLIVGCRAACAPDPNPGTGLYQQVYRSDDGGATWTPLTLPPSVIHSDQMGGPGGPVWWASQDGGTPLNLLGKSFFGVSSVRVDPTDTDRIFVSGSGSVWRSDDGGLTWYPTVNGLMVTMAKAIAVDPNDPSRVYVGVEDWTFLYSDDRGTTVHRASPPNQGGWGTAIAVDPATSRVFVATGGSDPKAGGDVYSADPNLWDWTSEGLGAADGGRRADAMAVDDVSGEGRVILASVVGSGIWRKSGATWSKVLTKSAFLGGVPGISWVPGSKLVYVYDRSTGLWLSNDAGKTWGAAPIWAQTSVSPLSGSVGADPTDPSRVYVSVDDGMYRITDADTSPVATLLSVTEPGAVTVDDSGAVWTGTLQGPDSGAKLYRSLDQGATWPSFEDDYYRAAGGWPTQIAVGSDGYQYVSQLHGAFLVGLPLAGGVAPAVTGLSPAEGSTLGGTSITISGTNLSGATGVLFGRTAAATFTVVNPTTITATSPPGDEGTVDVTVTTPGGTSPLVPADLFSYLAPPAITSVSPTSGPPEGGTKVTIMGTDLTDASSVTFGATPAASFDVISASKIMATSPAGPAGTVDVRVTTTGGTSATVAADHWTWTGVGGNGESTAGTLDVTFDGDGMVTTNFGKHDDFSGGLDIQPDGKIVAAGAAAYDGDNPKFALVRYNPDGSRDTTFSGDGKVRTDFTSGKRDAANDVVVQPDGRIVAAGVVDTTATNSRFALVRYTSDGTLDTTFSGDGKKRTNFTSGDDIGEGVALLGDGRIVAVGVSDADGSNAKFAVALFTPDGALDTSFGGDGTVTTNFSSHWDGADDVAVQSDGRIVVAGESGSGGSNPKFAVARYNTDGTLDTTFGGDGKVKVDLTDDEDYALGVSIDSQGRIVLAGGAGRGGSNPTFGLARLEPDGTLDPTFGGDGMVTTGFSSHTDHAAGVAIQADGRIVAAGQSGAGGSNPKFAVARYDSDGSLDTTFSGNGKCTTDFASGKDGAADVAILPDGEIVAAGSSDDASLRFALAQYLAA